MYKEFKQLNLPEIDKEILKFWDDEKIFELSVEQRDTNNAFVFYEGPPSANGLPGIHHVMARAIKDIFCRYQTLNGKRVERKGGWDTHGLPIELSVEKELGITKEDIGKKISIDEYNQKCRDTVMRYKDVWDDITRKMGYWVDLQNPYITYENDYIESVWSLLQKLYNKDLMYKGYTIQPYSPAAGTGLSSHELNQPGTYKDVTDTTVAAMFKVSRNADVRHWTLDVGKKSDVQRPTSNVQSLKSDFLFDTPDEDVRIAAWTTTPWTLPSNTALTVGPKIDYVKIKTHNPYTHTPVSVVMAEKLVGKWFGGKNQPVIEHQSASFKGEKLAGIRYEQLLPYAQPTDGDAFVVITGDFVTTEDGTGVVHTAPSFGADDMKVGIANGIGSLTLVDKQGKFTENVGEFSGRYVKDYKDDPNYVSVDIDISVKLKLEGNALNVQKYVHTYPHCWRTDKPVLYYPLDAWFIRASKVRKKMVALNKTINWKPASTGEGRFGKWLENLQDWNLSRSRYWGIPLPIWRTDEQVSGSRYQTSSDSKQKLTESQQPTANSYQPQEKCIGSIKELQKEIQKANQTLTLNQSVPKDLHRPYIDDIILVSDDGRPMRRELDLIDVWFDSGSMPYAQWHYPFENKKKFKENFPADFISEGVDQTRGWFYTLHAIAVMVYGKVAFKNVVSTGLVLDKNGQKMSKRLGNAVDPFETISKYGADATRWYMMSNAQPWDNLKFDVDGIVEVRNKFFGTLYNTYNFFALYANVDGFVQDETNQSPIEKREELDRWILSKLNSLVIEVTAAYEDYDPTAAARAMEKFVDEHLSNWYVRLSRRRFWKGEMSEDKKMAYETLYQCLMVVGQLASPIAPFFSDWLYRNLTENIRAKAIEIKSPLRHASVHLTDLTKTESRFIDKDLEESMDYAQRISSLILSIRKKEKIRVRQPLTRALLPILNDGFEAHVRRVQHLIVAETNIKTLEFIKDTSGIVTKKIKPNFKTLGKKLGGDMKIGQAAIENLSQEDIKEIEKTGRWTLDVGQGTDASPASSVQRPTSTYELALEDFVISSEDIPGWQVANDGEVTVALDINLNDTLVAEGTARDLVNRIQNIRKDKNLDITDRIHISVEKHDAINAAIENFSDYIKAETLADRLDLMAQLAGEEVALNDEILLKMNVILSSVIPS